MEKRRKILPASACTLPQCYMPNNTLFPMLSSDPDIPPTHLIPSSALSSARTFQKWI